VKIVNKRQRNLLTEIQNVFINGKQIKTAKITQIIPWFPLFYGTKTTTAIYSVATGHMREQWQRLLTEVWGSLTAWKWVVVI